MQKHNFKKSILMVSLASLIVVSTAAASVMTGCGKPSNSSSSAVTETSVVTKVVDVTESTTKSGESSNDKTSSNNNTNSSNADSSSKNSSANSSSSTKSSSTSSKSSSNAESSESNSNSASSSGSFVNKNKTHTSEKICKVDNNKYYVGDTVTCTYKLKSPQKLENYQAYITYDSKYLKVKSAKLSKPASINGMVNYANLTNKIIFLGSDITTGYDYTKSGDLLTVTYTVLKEGSTKSSFVWEVATGFLPNEKSYVTNGKADKDLKITSFYS